MLADLPRPPVQDMAQSFEQNANPLSKAPDDDLLLHFSCKLCVGIVKRNLEQRGVGLTEPKIHDFDLTD